MKRDRRKLRMLGPVIRWYGYGDAYERRRWRVQVTKWAARHRRRGSHPRERRDHDDHGETKDPRRTA